MRTSFEITILIPSHYFICKTLVNLKLDNLDVDLVVELRGKNKRVCLIVICVTTQKSTDEKGIMYKGVPMDVHTSDTLTTNVPKTPGTVVSGVRFGPRTRMCLTASTKVTSG